MIPSDGDTDDTGYSDGDDGDDSRNGESDNKRGEEEGFVPAWIWATVFACGCRR